MTVRLAFMGSPDFAVPALRALHAAGHDIAAVYCQPPRPAGRGHAVRRCPVHEAADALSLPVRTPARLRKETTEHTAFADLGLDVAVVCAYGLILPAAMLAAPASARIPVIALAALAGLGLLGVTGGHLAKARKGRAALRVLLGGGLAMGISALIGRLIGAVV